MNPPLLIVSAIAITLVWWLITAGILLLGSRITGIRDRSFGRSLGIAVLSGIASFILGAGLGHLPVIAPAGGFIAFLFGILAASFFLKVWSQATVGRALGAAALGYLLPLALVAFLGMVAAILIPALSKGLSNAALVSTVSNGANLYKSAVSVPLAEPGQAPPWTASPAKGRYRTSTEYFRDLVESGRMAVSYEFFSEHDLPAAARPAQRTSPPRTTLGAWCSDWRMRPKAPPSCSRAITIRKPWKRATTRSSWKMCRRSEKTEWWSF
jgi:hypothetical protein